MLAGIYTYNVDQKGRIVMPGRFLDEIGNPFVLGGHPNGYLVAASSPEAIQDKSSIRGYVECQIKDRTGRFVIPSALRDYAELVGSGEATVVGVGDEVEIWNKRRWENAARLGSAPTRPAVEDPLAGGPSTPRVRRPETNAQSFGGPGGGTAFGNTQGRPSSSAPFAHQYTPRSHFAPPERASVTQKTIYGQPYIEVEGALNLAETDKVLTRLEMALRGRPRTIFLDLRRVDTVDASFLLAMEPTTYQLTANGGRLAILTERQDVAALIHRLCSSPQLRVFPDLESALWWLVDEGHA
jgi:MraZ protein